MEGVITFNNPSLSLPKSERPEGAVDELTGHDPAQPISEIPHPTTCPESVAASHPVAALPHFPTAVADYLQAAIADSTRRAYQADTRAFIASGATVPATPEQIASYLAGQGGLLSPFTLARRLVAISKAHRALGYADPCNHDLVRSTLRGIRRVHGAAQRQVDPLLKEDILAVVDVLPSTTKGVRDRALLLVGFGAALRRSELSALAVEDVRFVTEGIIVRLRRSKTDQEAAGRDIGVPYARSRACPVKALRTWLDHASITSGPIFRAVGKGGRIQPCAMTTQSVALLVKHYAAEVGLDPERFSGHSLRAGLITSAAKLGVSTYKIQQQSGHRSEAMLARYIRDGELFVMNAAGAVL